MTGHLAGINTAIYSRSGGSQGIGFAIPANMVRVVVASAKSGVKAVKRPWLGARLQAVTPEIAESLGLKLPSGALVASVVAGSPAARAGLKSSDLIVAIDGQEVEDPNAFDYRFATRPLGGTAQIDAAARRKAGQADGAARNRARWRAQRNRADVALAVPGRQSRQHFAGGRRRVASRCRHRRRRRHRDRRRHHRRQCRLPEGRHHPGGEQPEDRQDQRSGEGDEGIHRGSGASRWCAAASRSTSRWADEPETTTRGRNPVRCRGAGAGRAASACRPPATAYARRCRRPGPYPGPRRRADTHAADAHAGIADFLGTARHRQDHGGAAFGGCHRIAFRAALGGVFRRRRSEEGVRRGAGPARDGQGNAAVRRRGASFQPRAAGFLSARDGRRHGGADRRHHRKSLLRAQRGAVVAGAGAGVSLA